MKVEKAWEMLKPNESKFHSMFIKEVYEVSKDAIIPKNTDKGLDVLSNDGYSIRFKGGHLTKKGLIKAIKEDDVLYLFDDDYVNIFVIKSGSYVFE